MAPLRLSLRLPITDRHQTISGILYALFLAYILPRGGKIQYAPLRLRIRDGKLREPDLLLVKDLDDSRRQDRFWTGADLTLEVVREDYPKRDLVDKRQDYSEGHVPEYWIVNPLTESITIHVFKGNKYKLHGQFRRGESAISATLEDFEVNVDEVFDAD